MIAALVGGLLGKVFGTVDKYVTNKGEAVKLKAELKMAFVDVEKQLIEAPASIIIAEAQSESWITRTWRPIFMILLMGSMVVSVIGGMAGYGLNIAAGWDSINDKAWLIMQIGLGGYVGGRTIEKTAKIIAPMIKRRK